MVPKLLNILLVWSYLWKSCFSEECPSDSSEISNNVWSPTNEEAVTEENTVSCECCIAVSYVLHTSFESAHKNRPDTIGRLSYPDILDITGKQVDKKQ